MSRDQEALSSKNKVTPMRGFINLVFLWVLAALLRGRQRLPRRRGRSSGNFGGALPDCATRLRNRASYYRTHPGEPRESAGDARRVRPRDRIRHTKLRREVLPPTSTQPDALGHFLFAAILQLRRLVVVRRDLAEPVRLDR